MEHQHVLVFPFETIVYPVLKNNMLITLPLGFADECMHRGQNHVDDQQHVLGVNHDNNITIVMFITIYPVLKINMLITCHWILQVNARMVGKAIWKINNMC